VNQEKQGDPKETLEKPSITGGQTEDQKEKTVKPEMVVKPQEEIDKEMQAEADRRVSQALQTAGEQKKKDIDAAVLAERERAKNERLKEEGQYKELFEKAQARLDVNEAEAVAVAFKAEALSVCNSAECGEFGELLLTPMKTSSEVRDAALKIKALIEHRVNEEVEARLNTGRTLKSSTPGGLATITQLSQLKTEAEKAAFIGEHGVEKFKELCEAEMSTR